MAARARQRLAEPRRASASRGRVVKQSVFKKCGHQRTAGSRRCHICHREQVALYRRTKKGRATTARYRRTEKYRLAQAHYEASDKGKARRARFDNSEKGVLSKRRRARSYVASGGHAASQARYRERRSAFLEYLRTENIAVLTPEQRHSLGFK